MHNKPMKYKSQSNFLSVLQIIFNSPQTEIRGPQLKSGLRNTNNTFPKNLCDTSFSFISVHPSGVVASTIDIACSFTYNCQTISNVFMEAFTSSFLMLDKLNS